MVNGTFEARIACFGGELGAAIGVGRLRRIGFVEHAVATGPLCARIEEAKTRRWMPMRCAASASSAVARRLTRS